MKGLGFPDDSYDEYTGSGDGEEEVVSATACEMPSRSLEGLWESLINADGVKSKLLDYIYATILFSDSNVDCKDLPPLVEEDAQLYAPNFCLTVNIVSWNRVVLLHGPPGTGKTSVPSSRPETLD